MWKIGQVAQDHTGYVAGLPRVTQPLSLRPQDTTSFGPLYGPNLCIGELVDCWKSVKRTIGHLQVGPQLSSLMERVFDDNPVLERTLLESI